MDEGSLFEATKKARGGLSEPCELYFPKRKAGANTAIRGGDIRATPANTALEGR